MSRLAGPMTGRGGPSGPAVALGSSVGSTLAIRIADAGQSRIDRGEPISLAELRAIHPEVESDEIARDAAIAMSLRAALALGVPRAEAVGRLIGECPEYEADIRLAAFLDEVSERVEPVSPDADSELALPCEFGPRASDGRRRYRLLEAVGRGANSTVYRAEDRWLTGDGHRAQVAVKVKRLPRVSDLESATLAQEAIRARGVEHWNIVRVLDAGVEKDPPSSFIVSEYVEGGTLAEWLVRSASPGDTRRVVEIVRQIASGLDAIHAARLVHSDLKPANILMRRDGTAAITDFGLALRHDAAADPRDRSWLFGTPAYMSPEQYAGTREGVTPSSDIYALGGVAWHLLTGAPPNGASMEEVAASHADPIPSSRRIAMLTARGIDRDLAKIVARCLETVPSARYRHASEVSDDLELWSARRPIPWTRPGVRRRALLLWRRRPGLVIGGVFAALLMIVLVVALRKVAYHQYIEKKLNGEVRSELTRVLNDPNYKARMEAVLTATWALRYLEDSPILGEAIRAPGVLPEERDLLPEWIALRERAGRTHDIETLLLRMQQGMLLLTDSTNIKGTEAYVTDTMTRAAEVFPPGDLLTLECRLQHAAAVVKTLWFKRKAEDNRLAEGEQLAPLTPEEESRLRAAERVLLEAESRREDLCDASTSLTLRALRHMYSRQLLFDVEKWRQYPAPPKSILFFGDDSPAVQGPTETPRR